MLKQSVLLLLAHGALAAPPCDDELAQGICGEESMDGPQALHKCFLTTDSISAECKKYVDIHEACMDVLLDEQNGCGNAWYNQDTDMCLGTWKRDHEKMTDACLAFYPIQEEVEEEIDAEKAAWRAERKRHRQASADQARAEQGGKKKKKKKKKSKKKKEEDKYEL